jgi:signal transduction histidine kinase
MPGPAPTPAAGSAAAELDQLTQGRNVKLEELVDREGLAELIRSFSVLFGLSVRLYGADGQLLADASEQQAMCAYVNQHADGRAACATTVSAVKRASPAADGHQLHPCFTGAQYHIASVEYDARAVGKVILGPYLPAELRDVPRSLAASFAAADPVRARELLPKMPRARTETVDKIAEHMRAELDLILFSGHKALLTSEMHLASVRESYKELQDKNARLQEAYDKLKELDRLKSNFIATVSHELRTPLTSIIGYSEMLSEGIAGQLNAEQIEFVQTVREKGEQLLGLIMSLLDLSKLESGTMPVQLADLDVGQLLREVAGAMRPAARKKDINLHAIAPDGLPPVRADANRLRQALLNLADNAVKFTQQGGEVTLSVRVGSDAPAAGGDGDFGFALVAPARACLEVRVADTGIGIPESERQKVFDPFYQVDSSSTREYGGTGLGLAIVKRLIEAHDGRVRIEPNEPSGTVVVISLPVHQPGA